MRGPGNTLGDAPRIIELFYNDSPRLTRLIRRGCSDRSYRRTGIQSAARALKSTSYPLSLKMPHVLGECEAYAAGLDDAGLHF